MGTGDGSGENGAGGSLDDFDTGHSGLRADELGNDASGTIVGGIISDGVEHYRGLNQQTSGVRALAAHQDGLQDGSSVFEGFCDR